MKNYVVRFGLNNPANYTGLSPTFMIFASIPGASVITSPGITEMPSGSGIYYFGFTSQTFPVAFKIDGGATLSASDRYLVGILDPLQAVDEKIGTVFDSYGSTVADPTTVLGYLKRNLERDEGTANFNSATGLWIVLSRSLAQGVTVSPVAFFSHTLTNSSGAVTKS